MTLSHSTHNSRSCAECHEIPGFVTPFADWQGSESARLELIRPSKHGIASRFFTRPRISPSMRAATKSVTARKPLADFFGLNDLVDALEKLLELIQALRADGVNVRYLDIGGGLGITYNDERPPLPKDASAWLIS